MPNETFDNVPVRVVRDEEQGMYVIGVVVDGAFVSLAHVKLGHGDTLRERAAEALQAEAQPQQ